MEKTLSIRVHRRESVVQFLWLRPWRGGRFAHCGGNSIEMPFHESFMNYLPGMASYANQAQSRLIKLLFVLRQPLLAALAAFGFHYVAMAGGMLPPALVGRDEAGGRALAEQIRSAMPEEDSEIHGVFLVSAGKTRNRIPVVCEVKRHEGTWETIYQAEATALAGAERLAIIHSTNGPSRYFYARAAKPGGPLPEPAPVLPAAMEGPFAGSDFSLGDLGLEFLHWPGQCELKGEMRLGRPCYVLESTHAQPGGIARVKSWIDKESLGPLVAEAYDSEGREIKEFSLDSKSFKKDARGHWQVEEMTIENLKTHSHTDLKLDMPKAQ
jgi:hypothetical protein